MSPRTEPSNPRGAARQTAPGMSIRYVKNLHQDTARNAMRRLASTPMATLLTCLVIAISLTLPTLLYLATDNLREVASRWDGTPRMTLFLQKNLSVNQVKGLQREIQSENNIAQIQYLTPEESLAEYEAFSGNSNLVRHLDENPLPAVFIIHFNNDIQPATAHTLQQTLLKRQEVELAQLDLEWVQRLHQLNRLARQASLTLGALFGITVLLAIGNTIRLAVENRRAEIRIIKLVGGTNGYVTLPFLYMGLWYGLIGGVISWILTGSLIFWMSDSLNELARLYDSSFDPAGPDIMIGLMLCSSGGLLGLAGAFISCSKQLRNVEI